MNKQTREDSKVSETEKRAVVLNPEEVFSLPEPIRFGLLYGQLKQTNQQTDKEGGEV